MFGGFDSAKEYGTFHEQRVANMLGLQTVRGSGCSKWNDRKGDAKDEEFVLEHKATTKNSFSVSQKHLMKIFNQANASTPHTPLFGITFSEMPRPYQLDYIVMRINDFIAMKEELEQLRAQYLGL